jgi:hypothetical protein
VETDLPLTDLSWLINFKVDSLFKEDESQNYQNYNGREDKEVTSPGSTGLAPNPYISFATSCTREETCTAWCGQLLSSDSDVNVTKPEPSEHGMKLHHKSHTKPVLTYVELIESEYVTIY